VTGTIECIGADGIWDTCDDEYYTLEKSGSVDTDLTVVAVDKLQWKIGGGAYADVTGTLYVAKGSTVDFKALKDPSDAPSWPTGKPAWSGTSGASGTGETNPPPFNTLSTSTTDYKTVIAECGNEETANVIVFEVNIKHSDGTSDPPEYLGLDGTLQLKAVPSPSGLSGNYTWSETSPKISLTDTTSQTVTVNGDEASASVDDAQVEVEFDPTGPGNTDTDTHDVTVVKVTALDVTGATYNSTTQKWYCTEDSPGDVTITATISPAVSAGNLPSGFMQWSVAPTTTLTKVTELVYTFSKSTAGEFVVTVKAGENGTVEEDVTIVVMKTGYVEFDCTMTNASASSVLTATGTEPIYNCAWNDGTPKTKVYFDYNPDQTTYIRVNAASATSANNSVQLDGSKVAHNGDNYNFTITPP